MILPTLVDGTPVSPDTPAILPTDRGITLGDGLFETIKVERGVPWYLDRHLIRLVRSSARLGIPVPSALRSWIDVALGHPAVSVAEMLALRVTLTRGRINAPGLAGGDNVQPTTIVACSAVPPTPAALYTDGLSVHVSSAPRNERSFTTGLKTTSYLESVLALREAHAAGADDALFLDTRGFVSEASASNVFAWLDDTLVTPSQSCGPLPGITKDVITEMAIRNKIAVTDREFTLDELRGAREAFCTSSLRGIAPLTRLDTHPIGDGTPGPVTRELITLYAAQLVRV